LTEGFLRSRGLESKEKIEATIRVIDKIGKLSKEQITNELRSVDLQESLIEQVMSFAALKDKPDKILAQSPQGLDDKGRQGLEELTKLAEILDKLGRIDRCVYDLSIVRGIGYYDGIVFEAYDRGGEDIGAIFAGGRYDGLCRIYGKRDMPATGVAGGIERMMLSMERAGLFPKLKQPPQVFVIAVNDSVRGACWTITQSLRKQGISVDFDLKRRAMKKQLEYTDSTGVPYVIIVGQKELDKGVVKLKDMAQRTEIEMTLDDAVNTIKRT